MQILCQQEQLFRGLTLVGRAVATKSTLPVLQNVLLATEVTAEGEFLRLAATNLEISLILRVPVQIQVAGSITVPARLLTDFVGSLPKDSSVAMQLDEQNLTLTVQSNRSVANIKGIAAEDFPTLVGFDNPVDTSKVISVLEAGVLKNAIGQVIFAASTDETRPVLTGMLASFSGAKLTLACADSFRLAVKTVALEGAANSNHNLILPARAMLELSHILTDKDAQVKISLTASKSQVLFKTANAIFISSLIEGNFPDYQKIIPKNYETRIVLATDQLLKAVKVASLFARDSGQNSVRLATGSGNLTLMADATIGDNWNELDATVDGEATKIALNAKFMQDAIGVVGSSQVALEIQNAKNPGVFRPVGSDDYVHVIMPMSLPNFS
jgi:DNA polymerase-3 subunit beta